MWYSVCKRKYVHLNIEPGVAHDAKSKSLIFFVQRYLLDWTWCDFFLEMYFLSRKKIGKTSFGPTRLKPGVVDRTKPNQKSNELNRTQSVKFLVG